MPERVSLVVLCEDSLHQSFIYAFLNRMKLPAIGRLRVLPCESKSKVFERFPIEVRALRRRHVRTQLVVVIDADELSDAQIRERLSQRLSDVGEDADFKKDPILIVRPRWEMENWALALLGNGIGEPRDQGARGKVGDRTRDAGRVLADHCKVGDLPEDTLPSLKTACTEWAQFRRTWSF
ncbi:MAG: hypothetical protein BGO01_09215 [Armatimonadetes bacterium 55-13]|nr:MAG: hypothetical protein ABT09_00715 [bacterium SCN 57-13]OJU62192.1 MAG: hypothetical protein BGO01_09215 [Armatimonadetes bacterium 55-13]